AAPDDTPPPGADPPAPPAASAAEHYRELRSTDLRSRRSGRNAPYQRRMGLPLVLFVATCLSTFWVGCAQYQPLEGLGNYHAMLHTISLHWVEGLTYMGAVLAILLSHEMGHFVMTVRHRIPASYPLCI